MPVPPSSLTPTSLALTKRVYDVGPVDKPRYERAQNLIHLILTNKVPKDDAAPRSLVIRLHEALQKVVDLFKLFVGRHHPDAPDRNTIANCVASLNWRDLAYLHEWLTYNERPLAAMLDRNTTAVAADFTLLRQCVDEEWVARDAQLHTAPYSQDRFQAALREALYKIDGRAQAVCDREAAATDLRSALTELTRYAGGGKELSDAEKAQYHDTIKATLAEFDKPALRRITDWFDRRDLGNAGPAARELLDIETWLRTYMASPESLRADRLRLNAGFFKQQHRCLQAIAAGIASPDGAPFPTVLPKHLLHSLTPAEQDQLHLVIDAYGKAFSPVVRREMPQLVRSLANALVAEHDMLARGAERGELSPSAVGHIHDVVHDAVAAMKAEGYRQGAASVRYVERHLTRQGVDHFRAGLASEHPAEKQAAQSKLALLVRHMRLLSELQRVPALGGRADPGNIQFGSETRMAYVGLLASVGPLLGADALRQLGECDLFGSGTDAVEASGQMARAIELCIASSVDANGFTACFKDLVEAGVALTAQAFVTGAAPEDAADSRNVAVYARLADTIGMALDPVLDGLAPDALSALYANLRNPVYDAVTDELTQSAIKLSPKQSIDPKTGAPVTINGPLQGASPSAVGGITGALVATCQCFDALRESVRERCGAQEIAAPVPEDAQLEAAAVVRRAYGIDTERTTDASAAIDGLTLVFIDPDSGRPYQAIVNYGEMTPERVDEMWERQAKTFFDVLDPARREQLHVDVNGQLILFEVDEQMPKDFNRGPYFLDGIEYGSARTDETLAVTLPAFVGKLANRLDNDPQWVLSVSRLASQMTQSAPQTLIERPIGNPILGMLGPGYFSDRHGTPSAYHITRQGDEALVVATWKKTDFGRFVSTPDENGDPLDTRCAYDILGSHSFIEFSTALVARKDGTGAFSRNVPCTVAMVLAFDPHSRPA